ncbi:MAG TPA: hypothetical protein QF630_10625, partial [Alphaproteobacteria bacterium]|nr:hypothetical protein [Alphaproteobacteria bacterium]
TIPRSQHQGILPHLTFSHSLDPQVFTRIHMHYIVSGRGPSEDKVARAIKLSAEKYCSASAMLSSTANISHDFEVIESA